MTRYRIVKVGRATWAVQSKGWLFWRDEGTMMMRGSIAPYHFPSEQEAEAYIDGRMADEKAWAEPPREYPSATV